MKSGYLHVLVFPFEQRLVTNGQLTRKPYEHLVENKNNYQDSRARSKRVGSEMATEGINCRS